MTRNLSLALLDLRESIARNHVWRTLAWQEIRLRYRRSTLGPFWLTISTGALIGGMGPLYGKLFGQDMGAYLPYLAIGFILWQLMAAMITDSCQAFIVAETFIKQVKLPLSAHVLRMAWRNLIIFAHNLVIVLVVLLFYPPSLVGILLAMAGIAVVAVNSVWIGLLLGMLSARFRDIPQIVASVVQVVFFLTPVLWKYEMLGRHGWAAQINPFYHFLEIVRAPLLTGAPDPSSWPFVALVTLIGCVATLAIFSRYRARIAYWV